jgi:hypothetical protein
LRLSRAVDQIFVLGRDDFPRMMSEAFSATRIVGAFVLHDGTKGNGRVDHAKPVDSTKFEIRRHDGPRPRADGARASWVMIRLARPISMLGEFRVGVQIVARQSALSRFKAKTWFSAYAHVRDGTHACRQFLASDVGDDEGVGSRRLNNLHLGIERRHALRVAVDAFAVVHSLELT